MLSISVAICIDVYGMVYVLALALLLIVPRGDRFFVLVWVGYPPGHYESPLPPAFFQNTSQNCKIVPLIFDGVV